MPTVRTLLAAAVVLLAMSADAALAGPTCTTEPREKWMAQETFKERVVEEHRIDTVRKFVVTKQNCYEIYGFRDGRQVEIYFDPVTGRVVQEGD